MIIRLLFCLIPLIFAPLILLGCSNPAGKAALTAHGPGKPALWAVYETGQPDAAAYLFGTIHRLPPGTAWQTPLLDMAIRRSDGLVTEVTDFGNTAAIAKIYAKLGTSPNLPPIEKRIPPALAGAFKEIVSDTELSPDALRKMESWAAALTIAGAVGEDLGMKASLGAEPILQAHFRRAGKMHGGLESTAQQLGYFDMLPEADQRLLLTASLRTAAAARAETQKMLDHWRGGNIGALLIQAQQGALASPNLRSNLLDSRNRRWADQVAQMIDQGRKPFVAVGAAHMAGPGGLPALLAARGYKIKRIQ